MNIIKNELVGTITELDPEENYVDHHILDDKSVYNKVKKITKVQWLRLTCMVGAEHTTPKTFRRIGDRLDNKEIIQDENVFHLPCFGVLIVNYPVATHKLTGSDWGISLTIPIQPL